MLSRLVPPPYRQSDNSCQLRELSHLESSVTLKPLLDFLDVFGTVPSSLVFRKDCLSKAQFFNGFLYLVVRCTSFSRYFFHCFEPFGNCCGHLSSSSFASCLCFSLYHVAVYESNDLECSSDRNTHILNPS